jgi:hypothetical protein
MSSFKAEQLASEERHANWLSNHLEGHETKELKPYMQAADIVALLAQDSYSN